MPLQRRSLTVQLQGLDHQFPTLGGYLGELIRYITIEVIIQDKHGRRITDRKGCAADNSACSNLSRDLAEYLPGNSIDITFRSPWSRTEPGNYMWQDHNDHQYSWRNLDGLFAANLLSHMDALLVAIAKYFVIRRILQGNLWTNEFQIEQAFSALQRTNKSDLTEPRAFYERLLWDAFPTIDQEFKPPTESKN